MRARPVATDDRGETLLELLVAIAVLGVSAVAIAAGLAGTITVSSLHRQQSDAQRALHNYAETLQGTAYNACTASSPASYGLTATSGFGSPALTITYWNGSAFQSTCPATGDGGLQRVAIQLTNTDGRVSDSVTVVLRDPS